MAHSSVLGGQVAVQVLIGRKHTGRQPVQRLQVLPAGLESLGVLGVAGGLVADDGQLEALAHVHAVAVHPVLAGLVGGGPHHPVAPAEKGRPRRGLLVQQVAQRQQRRVAGPVIQPVHAHQVVAAAGLAPLAPLAQRAGFQAGQLVVEIPGHERNHPRVARGLVVLLQHLEHHHARPPVFGLLADRDRRAGRALGLGQGPEVAVGALVGQGPVHVFLHLGRERGVAEQVGQRHGPVEPIRRFLPAVAGPAEPAVIVFQLGVILVEAAGDAVAHHHQLLLQPALRLDGPQGHFQVLGRGEWGPVLGGDGRHGLGRNGRRQAQGRGNEGRQKLKTHKPLAKKSGP